MAGNKLLRGHYSVYAFYPEAVSDWSALSAAELNAAVTAGLGFDISCALTDDSTNINLTDPDTDDSISICDISNVETPTFDNYEVSFDSFRNGPAAGSWAKPQTPVYELPVTLFSAPDLPYVIVKRIGPPQGTQFAAGQIASAFTVNTDYPTDVLGDNENILFGSRFKPSGGVNVNATIGA